MTSLWLTDRSRYRTGTQDCMTLRYLEYHHLGYGVQRKAQNIPTVTGTRMHAILADMLATIEESKPKKVKGVLQIDREVAREVIGRHIKRYKRVCTARGFNDEDAPDAQRVITEQSNLMEGAAWAFVRVEAPRLIEDFRVISVEQEEEYVAACDCGLADGVGGFEDHDARDCQGIGQMSKPDLILERKSDRTLGNHDFKLKNANNIYENYIRGFQRNIQFLVGTLGAERRLERQITHYYVRVIKVGERKKGYEVETRDFTGPKIQQTSLCYGTYVPPNPPVQKKPLFKTDGKWYQKTPISAMQFHGKPEGWTNAEFWVKNLPLEDVASFFHTIGPHPRPDELKAPYFVGMISHEKDWRRKLWTLHEFIEENQDDIEAIRLKIFELFPPSWNCSKYARDCSMIPFCYQQAGWEDLLSIGYVLRRPHHEPERAQMEARGIPVPDEGEGEEDEEGGE